MSNQDDYLLFNRNIGSLFSTSLTLFDSQVTANCVLVWQQRQFYCMLIFNLN